MSPVGRIGVAAGALLVGVAGGWLAVGPEIRAEGAGDKSANLAKSSPGPAGKSSLPSKSRRGVTLTGSPADQVRSALHLAEGLSASELVAWLDEERFSTGDPLLDDLFKRILEDRLLEVDPEGAMERMLGVDLKQTANMQRARHLMSTWVREDPDAAEAFLLSRKRPKELWTLTRPVLEALVGTEPERALALVDTLQRVAPENTPGWVYGALGKLAVTHRAEILGSMGQWTPAWRSVVKGQIAGAWLGDDFAGGLQWMQNSPRGYDLFHAALTENAGFTPVLITQLRNLPAEWRARAVKENATDIVRRNPEDWLRVDAAALGIEADQLATLQQAARDFIKLRDGG